MTRIKKLGCGSHTQIAVPFLLVVGGRATLAWLAPGQSLHWRERLRVLRLLARLRQSYTVSCGGPGVAQLVGKSGELMSITSSCWVHSSIVLYRLYRVVLQDVLLRDVCVYLCVQQGAVRVRGHIAQSLDDCTVRCCVCSHSYFFSYHVYTYLDSNRRGELAPFSTPLILNIQFVLYILKKRQIPNLLQVVFHGHDPAVDGYMEQPLSSLSTMLNSTDNTVRYSTVQYSNHSLFIDCNEKRPGSRGGVNVLTLLLHTNPLYQWRHGPSLTCLSPYFVFGHKPTPRERAMK